jgi:hypothetical protein
MVLSSMRSDQVGDVLGPDGQFGHGLSGLLHLAQDLAHEPVGRLLGPGSGREDAFVPVGLHLVGGDHAGVVFRQAQHVHVAAHPGLGKFRKGGADVLDEFGGDHQRDQVGFREVAVVVGVFLGAQRPRGALGDVVGAGLLGHDAAVVQDLRLADDLHLDGLLDVGEGVHVLEFHPVAQRGVFSLAQAQTLASQRKLPSSMLPSHTPRYSTICLSLCR